MPEPRSTEADAAWFAERLLGWSEEHQRPFLWRDSDDDYVVLVCEVLLRRSRSGTVERVAQELFQRWPTAGELARADEYELQETIRPLGLVRRAAQLIALAREFTELGQVPHEPESLARLPGVGPYTVAAFLGLPAVDGTSARVYRRFFGQLDAPRPSTVDDDLWALVEAISPRDGDRARRLNWAVLDLAAGPCAPKNPVCGACPLQARCNFAMVGS